VLTTDGIQIQINYLKIKHITNKIKQTPNDEYLTFVVSKDGK